MKIQELEEVYFEYIEFKNIILQKHIDNEFIDIEENEDKIKYCRWCCENNINLTPIEIGFVCPDCFKKYKQYKQYKRFKKSKTKEKHKTDRIVFTKNFQK